jgi:Lon protease-like protein
MEPRYPFIQPFSKLPEQLPLYTLENALLPGGELPLELSTPDELALFFHALKSDQLVGMIQPNRKQANDSIYQIGCAGRIRQYRERKDGRMNVMLTGVCRYKIIETLHTRDGITLASIDWTDFENDYKKEFVDPREINNFKFDLRRYFDQHHMQIDWNLLDSLPIEQIVNNLVLIINFDVEHKQQLLESPTVSTRMTLFSRLISAQPDPILAPAPDGKFIN